VPPVASELDGSVGWSMRGVGVELDI